MISPPAASFSPVCRFAHLRLSGAPRPKTLIHEAHAEGSTIASIHEGFADETSTEHEWGLENKEMMSFLASLTGDG